MNNEYYKQVLEDVKNDLAEVEDTVSELHGVERYVQRKMEADDNGADSKLSYDEYQALLNDVREDVDGARSKIGELRGVGNFAREKLKAAGVEVEELEASPKPTPEKAPPEKSAPTSEARGAKDDETTKEEKSPLEKPGQVDTMKTVEFGPDGFPMSK